MAVHVVDHPLAKHLVNSLRDRTTRPEAFRQMSRTLSTMLVFEATRGIRCDSRVVETPLAETVGDFLGQGLAVVPVLRAGLAMLESALILFPDVAVGYIGLERDHNTAVAHSYYCKLPNLADRFTLCVDPMLATGGSASQAVALLKANGAKPVVFVSVISAPEGIERLQRDHPDVEIYTAAVDDRLNELKYIVPGLGDFGDRLYGTM
ncbi:MAG: uracil phosphoribosyltransferase [Chthonomonas sp.]|nr:uracil phosphoribosyltransferase [Chthonomonas sp.]